MSSDDGVAGPPAFLTGGGICGALMRETDWAKTPVGPIERWPASLKTVVGMMLHSRQPMFLWWGPELVQLYNDAYLPSFGRGKHPAAMGQRGADCWREVWPIIWPQIDDVMGRAVASWNEDQLVPIERNGRIEEVYWTYGYSPIFDEDGAIGGTLVVCTETTKRVLVTRRLSALRELGDRTAAAAGGDAVYEAAADILSRSPHDIPFALMFRRRADQATLVASFGLDAAATPALEGSLRDAVRRRVKGGVVAAGPIDVAPGVPPIAGRPWSEPATQVFIADVRINERLDGVIVFGLSPRLSFDADYHDYLLQLSEQLGLALSRIEVFRARALAESERRSLLEQAPVATALLIGPEHVYELANPKYREMVGRDVIGKRYLDAFPEVRETALPGILERVYRLGEPYATNEMLVPLDRRGDGTLEDVYFQFNLEPMRDAAGAVFGMMVLAIDITASVRARRVLEAAHVERENLLTELASANRAKDEFLAMLGHELRNPLSPIVTALQLMRLRGDGTPSREEAVIERQVDHLVRLVDDLLDVSKITRGKVELKKETVEIAEVVAKAVEMASVLYEQRSHRLHIDVPRRGLAWNGDPVRLAQVLANLLTNAARYTDIGGNVELSAARDGHEIVIAVRDNGVGIAPEMLPRIFDLFTQAKRSSNRVEGGLGLGLTLVKTLVAMHGGTVVARSEGLGRGSEFIVRLPATDAKVPAPPPARDATRAAAEPRRVLVVDDNVDAAELLAETLRLAGHEVAVAHDPLAALDYFKRAAVDLAILDIGLPVMDGYELAAQAHQLAPGCRLIALTGYGQDHDVARSRQAGFRHHLVKPVDVELLLRTIADGAPPAP